MNIESKITVKEMNNASKEILKIQEDVSKDLENSYRKVVGLMQKYMNKKSNKNKMEIMLFLHKELLKFLILYPVQNIRIGKAGNKKLDKEASYVYNVSMAKDIVDTEMADSGAAEKLAELVYEINSKTKPSKKDMSYIG